MVMKKLFIGALTVLSMAHTQISLAADPYPSSPIKLVVPFAASGGTDAVARVVAQVLASHVPQPVIVDNKPGAGGSIGTMAVVQASADGYTLLLGSNGTMVLNPALNPALKYQVEKDLVPVAGIASIPFLIAANPQFKASDIKSLIAAAKTERVTFASSGNGTTAHLVGVLMESMAKVEMTHVPYRGAAPAMNDVVGGQVHFMPGDLNTLLPMVNSGKLRAIAVTGSQRAAILPNVPTVAESGLPGFEATGWFGVFAPKGTPQAIVDKLSADIAKALTDPRVAQRLHALGGTPMQLSPDQLRELVRSENQKWRKVITDNRVTADSLQ